MNNIYIKEDDYNEIIFTYTKRNKICWWKYPNSGIALFLYGFFVSDYGNITGIGIGTIMGAVFIFVMGIFLVASEEMIIKIRGRKAK